MDDAPLGEVADKLMSGVGSDYRVCVEYWRDRCGVAEQELSELQAELEASTAIDLLKRYRTACIENVALTRRVAELESRAATAGAAVEALRGNR